jgi:hypothetical protein
VDLDDHRALPVALIPGAEHIKRQAALARAAVFHIGFKGDAIQYSVLRLRSFLHPRKKRAEGFNGILRKSSEKGACGHS